MPTIARQRWSVRHIPSREASRTTDAKTAPVGDTRVGAVKLLRSWFAHRGVLAAAVGAVVAVVVLVFYAAGVLGGLERQSVDQRFSWRGHQSPGADIVIVGIDQKTLQSLGVRPPLPRADYAKVLDQLRAAGARLIGVDTQFIGRSDPHDDTALLDAVARDGPVLLATHDGAKGPITVPADVANAPGAVLASAAIEKDPDGVLRRMLYAPMNVRTLAVRAAELLRKSVNVKEFPANHASIDFRGPPGTFPRYSFVDVMAGTVPPSAFAGKAVLVGVTDPVGEDLFVTSASPVPMPGVEVHANALWTALAGVPLKSVGVVANVALILTLIAIPVLLGARRSGLFTLGASVGLLVVFVAGAQVAFNSGAVVTVAYPLLGLAVATAGMIGVDAYVERRKRAALERDLGELLPPLNPPAFFISYRRSQNTVQAIGIRQELIRRYGAASVFVDTSSIDYGESFPDRILNAIRGCSVMLVLIGPHWLERVNGSRRIDEPDDWVRRELEAGLQRREAVIVPMLFDGASAPTAAELPDTAQRLAQLHAFTATGHNFRADIDKLMRSVDRGRRRAANADSETPAIAVNPETSPG
jgi:CHASE2 domain-containing sensor protein